MRKATDDIARMIQEASAAWAIAGASAVEANDTVIAAHKSLDNKLAVAQRADAETQVAKTEASGEGRERKTVQGCFGNALDYN